MIKHAIEQAFRRAHQKNWDRIYVAVDVHGVILIPTYENDGKKEFYPFAQEVMQYLTQRDDVVLMMYTCSHPDEIHDYLEFFESNGIHFDEVNENKEVRNDHLGDYDHKPYMNLLLDDKAGFVPEEWPEVLALMQQHKSLKDKA